MGLSYREECVVHKDVQRGIKDVRPVGGKAKVKCDWLVILLDREYFISSKEHGALKLFVWGEFRDEQTALQAMTRGVVRIYESKRRVYYCHRDVFELMKPLWRDDRAK